MPFYDAFIQLFYDFVFIVLRHNSTRYKWHVEQFIQAS